MDHKQSGQNDLCCLSIADHTDRDHEAVHIFDTVTDVTDVTDKKLYGFIFRDSKM